MTNFNKSIYIFLPERVSDKLTTKRTSKSAPIYPLSRRNMVLITGPKIDVTGLNKVAQIVEKVEMDKNLQFV